MIRRLFTSLIFGLITTIAAAWGLTLAFDPAAGKITGSVRWGAGSVAAGTVSQPDWWIWVFESPGTLMVQRAAAYSSPPLPDVWREELEIPAWSALHRQPLPKDLSLRGIFVEEARGWPRLCLLSRRQYGTYIAPPGAVITPFSRTGLALPFEPIWSGILVNTAIYAMVWFLLLVAPGMIRRAIRRKRGSCVGCGYDLRGAVHAQCPECGAAAG